MSNWLSTWGALTIALVALVQPWLRALYRRYLKPGSIRIFETGLIEVSYGGLGVGLSLLGVLLARDRDFFVRRMVCVVVRESDSSQHQFEWNALRPLQIPTTGFHTEVEMPAGFMLLTSDPRRYNAFFIDSESQRRLWVVLQPLREVWNQIWSRHGLDLLVDTPGGTPPDQFKELLADAHRDASIEFRSNPTFLEARSALDRLCFWEAGRYLITLSIETPDKAFSSDWAFELSDDDARGLRANVERVMSDALGWESPLSLYSGLAKYEPTT